MNPNDDTQVSRYIQEIRRIYREKSRVPLLSRIQIETNPNAPNFQKIGKRFVIPHEYFEPGHHIIVHPFAEFMVLSEFQYVIDTLRETVNADTESNSPPDMSMIDSAVTSMFARRPRPADYIIVPIAFYVDLHKWVRPSRRPVIYYEDRQACYSYLEMRLRLLWSNKFINLNEIIVGNSHDSLWRYKPSDKNEMLTVDFSFDELDPILRVQQVFKFEPPSPENIFVIRFSEDLCRLEET